MEQTVYIDLYFLINFSMDLICFFVAARLYGGVFSPLRCVVASALGGVYACLALFAVSGRVAQTALDVLVCVLICFVAVMRRGQLRATLGFSVVYAAVSVALGGIMTALFSLYNRWGLDRFLGDESDADGLSVWAFVLMAAVAGAAAVKGVSGMKRRGMRVWGELEIEYCGQRTKLRAVCDSGNLLTEPISGLPCIIVDMGSVRNVLPSALCDAAEGGTLGTLSDRDSGRLRIVPTRTVSGNGMLYAIRPDCLRLNMGKGWYVVEAYLALSDLGENAYGAKALLPSTLSSGAP